MTKSQALYNFFSGFGMQAYPQNAVPEDVVFPWITYENTIGNEGDSVSITASLWYKTDSESVPNAKAEEISNAIGLGGITVPYDGGLIWIKRGTPWCMSVNDESDSTIKTRQLNIELEFE